MRLLLFFAFSALLLAACNSDKPSNHPTTTPNGTTSQVLSPADFEAKLAATPNAQLIDVRTPEEVAQGALPNAQNIDYQGATFKEQCSKLDKTKPTFVYCKKGGRSAESAKILQELQFKEVYDMGGGYDAWVETKKK